MSLNSFLNNPESPVSEAKETVTRQLNAVIDSMQKAIEKGDSLHIGLVFGQSLSELEYIRDQIYFI
jgi:nucleoid DNA-binding protein